MAGDFDASDDKGCTSDNGCQRTEGERDCSADGQANRSRSSTRFSQVRPECTGLFESFLVALGAKVFANFCIELATARRASNVGISRHMVANQV